MAKDDVTMNALLESVAKYFNVAEFTKLLLTFIFLFWAQLSLNHFTIIVVSLENTDNDSEWIKDFDDVIGEAREIMTVNPKTSQ